MSATPLRIVVLLSGHGSNLQAILDAIAKQELDADILAVISDKSDAYGLQRAQQQRIPTQCLETRDYPTREAFDNALQHAIDALDPDFIVLAGFMRILTSGFVDHFNGKLLNIHPSLLPKYRGLNTHRRVLEAGDQEHGVTVHFVTADLDSGPIIAQEKIAVRADDTIASLKQRIHELEHTLYPKVLQQLAKAKNLDI